jgi:hypothetical protein
VHVLELVREHLLDRCLFRTRLTLSTVESLVDVRESAEARCVCIPECWPSEVSSRSHRRIDSARSCEVPRSCVSRFLLRANLAVLLLQHAREAGRNFASRLRCAGASSK